MGFREVKYRKRTRTPPKYTRRTKNIIQYFIETSVNSTALCIMAEIKQKTIKNGCLLKKKKRKEQKREESISFSKKIFSTQREEFFNLEGAALKKN